MKPSERLAPVYDFDEKVLADVDRVAAEQKEKSFQELAREYDLNRPPRRLSTPGIRHSTSYLLLRPTARDFDQSHARVLYAPLGVPVDESMQMRAMRLFAADPSEQMVVMGGPAILGDTSNRIRFEKLGKVIKGELDAAIQPGIHALADAWGLTSIDVLGDGFGADAAAQAAIDAKELGIAVKRAVLIESPAMSDETTPKELLIASAKAWAQSRTYINRVDSPALLEATSLARNKLRYTVGMARAGNLAVTAAMTKGGFGNRVLNALEAQPELTVVLGRAVDSEVTTWEDFHRVHYVAAGEEKTRVGRMDLKGVGHAFANDIDLHAAVMLQGLKLTKRS